MAMHFNTVYCFKYYHQSSQRHREWLFLGHSHPGTAGESRPCGFLRRTRTRRVCFESQGQWSTENVAGLGIQQIILSDFACSPAVNVRRHYLMFDRIPGTSVPWICFWQNGSCDVFMWEFEGAWLWFWFDFFLKQGLSGPQPCCLVYGLMASHWIYDLQPTGPHPAPYPGNGLGGNLSWWRGWWPAGPAMGSGVSEIWRMWIATDWNRWLPRIDLMGRYFTIPPLWGRSFLFAAKLQELLPTG